MKPLLKTIRLLMHADVDAETGVVANIIVWEVDENGKVLPGPVATAAEIELAIEATVAAMEQP